MKIRVKVAVVLNVRETSVIARVLERVMQAKTAVAEQRSRQEIDEERRVVQEFLEKRHAAEGVASTDERGS